MKKIAVLGLGKVGRLASELLHDGGFTVTGFDLNPGDAPADFQVQALDLTDLADDADVFAAQDAVLSCLPFSLNKQLAQAAHNAGIHYFDLTEDVATTKAIIELSATSKGLMAPQCGLAPGFVGIVAGDFARVGFSLFFGINREFNREFYFF